MAYSFAQLEGLWIQAGGSTAMAPVMAAIALAESSGDPNAKNLKDNGGKQTSWGLWQISDGTHNMPVANILDPKVNAEQAVKKLKSQGLGAWGTYKGVRYNQIYAANTGTKPDTSGLPVGSTSTTNGTDASLTGDIGSAIGQGFADAFKAMLQPLVSLMIWGSEIMVGGALMLFGVVVFVMSTQAGKDATRSVGKLGLDAASMAAPEAAPELQMAKGGVKVPRQVLSARANRTATQTKASRAAAAKQNQKAP